MRYPIHPFKPWSSEGIHFKQLFLIVTILITLFFLTTCCTHIFLTPPTNTILDERKIPFIVAPRKIRNYLPNRFASIVNRFHAYNMNIKHTYEYMALSDSHKISVAHLIFPSLHLPIARKTHRQTWRTSSVRGKWNKGCKHLLFF